MNISGERGGIIHYIVQMESFTEIHTMILKEKSV